MILLFVFLWLLLFVLLAIVLFMVPLNVTYPIFLTLKYFYYFLFLAVCIVINLFIHCNLILNLLLIGIRVVLWLILLNLALHWIALYMPFYIFASLTLEKISRADISCSEGKRTSVWRRYGQIFPHIKFCYFLFLSPMYKSVYFSQPWQQICHQTLIFFLSYW